MNAIETKNLRRVYTVGRHKVAALDGVDITIRRGETVAVVGRSGSGKSTLMNVLGCMDGAATGSYWVMGRQVLGKGDGAISRLRRDMFGFVFQSFNLVRSLSARENVELALRSRNIPARLRRERAGEALALVGLWERASHLPSQLSGGQQQRVAIARAIAADPPIILADEPTGNLDSATADDIMEIFAKLNKDGKTILVVTHDIKLASALPRRITLQDGRVV